MKHLLLTTIAAVLLVGCGKSQQSSPQAEKKPKPATAKAPDISIHGAATVRNIKAVKQHIAAGTDVNAKDNFGRTTLHLAAAGGHMEIVELLIAAGADVNAKDNYGDYGKTPLSYAKGEIADLLRKHGGKTGEELKVEGK